MGIDLYDFASEHLIFRTTVIILPDETIVHRKRTRLICDLLKRIVYDRIDAGFIYANTMRISAFKADLVNYIERNIEERRGDVVPGPRIVGVARGYSRGMRWRYSDDGSVTIKERINILRQEINASLLCCVVLSHDPYDGREGKKILYLSDDEKRNFNSTAEVKWIALDRLLHEDVSEGALKKELEHLFDGRVPSVYDDKTVGMSWLSVFDFISLKPSMFGIGVDLNKVINAIRRHIGSDD
jgi:hypothetical protein